MNQWIIRSQEIQPLSQEWIKKAHERLDSQTRPQGSLGYLEDVIAKLVAIQQKTRPQLDKKRILIFAGDHGIEREEVSLYPREVTRAMVMNFLTGGATVSALAKQINADVKIIDAGVDGDFNRHEGLTQAKIGRGTRNFKLEPAMTVEELHQALELGWTMVEQAKKDQIDILVLGEMGIGNTTSASAIIAACLNVQPALVTGRGTGLNQEGLKHKIEVIEEAILRHKTQLDSPLNILRCLGGYEIAAMTGAILACGHYSLPVVVDGVVVAAAALCAYELNPVISDYMFVGHESEERAHRFVLEKFNQQPLLRLSMRLGEASGAALAVNILDAGVRIYNEVATFEEAQVANKKESARLSQ